MRTKKAIKIILSTFLFASFSYAQMNQFLADQYEGEGYYSPDSNDSEYEEDNSPFLIFEGDKEEESVQKYSKDESAFFGKPSEQQIKEAENLIGVSSPGSQEKSNQYLVYKNKEILRKQRYKARDRFNLSLMYDSFDYKNSAGSFERVYRDSEEIDAFGNIFISYDKFARNGIISFLYGGGLGVGYNGGKGVFEGESLSNEDSYDQRANFSLWTIPLDARIGAELSLGQYFALSLVGGPSFMFLMEHRSDKEEGEKSRDHRQFSPGYFGIANLKLNFSAMMTDLGFKVFSRDSINRLYMNFEARTHSYSNFKSKDVSITGNSFGIGFTYDFI